MLVCLSGGASVRKHKWFKPVDWAKLEARGESAPLKACAPPIKPRTIPPATTLCHPPGLAQVTLDGPEDLRNFRLVPFVENDDWEQVEEEDFDFSQVEKWDPDF